MVEQVLLLLALVVAALSVPLALLSAFYLAGADDTANNAVAALLGLLLVPACILSAMAVLALVRGDPWANTTVVLFAPAVLAAVAGPFGGPRSMHRSTPFTGEVMTSDGYFRPGDPGYPRRAAPSRRRLLAEVARMVGLFLVVPALVLLAELVAR
jgi:hypothetical protein